MNKINKLKEKLEAISQFSDINLYDEKSDKNYQFIDDGCLHVIRNNIRFSCIEDQDKSARELYKLLKIFSKEVDSILKVANNKIK